MDGGILGFTLKKNVNKWFKSFNTELEHLAYFCSECDVLKQNVNDQNLESVLGDHAVGLSRDSPTHTD